MVTQPRRKTKSTAAPFVNVYLVSYNVLSALGWSLVLYRTIAHLRGTSQSNTLPFIWVPSFIPASFTPLYTRACTTYDSVGTTTAYVQTGAVLEVLHVLLGLVRSPLPTTIVQVSSRLFSVWYIALRFYSAQRSPFYASMVLSWALTEVIRYAFYAATLLTSSSNVPVALTWLRYSTFFVLYPTGAGSEALVNFATLPVGLARSGAWFDVPPLANWDAFALVRAVLFVAWWPGLYPMYTHMIKQRRKIFGGGHKLGAKPKTH